MRRRLVGAIVGVAVVVLALYAVPRSIMLNHLVRHDEAESLQREADLVARSISHRIDAGGAIDAAVVDDLVEQDQELRVVLPDRSAVTSRPIEGETLEASAPLTGGGEVRLRLLASTVDERVRDALWPVLVIGAAAAAASLILGLIVSRRVVRPFQRLAEHAGALGPDVHVDAPRSGLPEADRIAMALDRSRDRLAQLVREEREFSANASHQLRTPLAALRLRLEDLTLWPETDDAAVRSELVASIAEVDRLSGTIDDLLALARTGGLGAAGEVDLVHAAEDGATRWREAYAEHGRAITVEASAPVVVPTSLGAVLQVLDVLLENALTHGSGAVTLAVAESADGWWLRVGDQGHIDGPAAERAFERAQKGSASAGEGIGLALARTLAGAVGARLRLVATDPTIFEMAFSRRA